MLITKMLLVVIDLHSMERKIDNSILQNGIFCAQQRKKITQIWNNMRMKK